MAITLSEKWESRDSTEGENPTVDLIYIIQGTDDDLSAKSALLSGTPLFYDGLVRQNRDITRIGQTEWLGTVRYGRKKPKETGDSVYNFDTTGGTQHITQSLETVNKYAAPGKVAPDPQGAIGWTRDGNVEGADITVPVYAFSETHYLAVATVTSSYRATLFNMTGKTNNAVFREFAIGECLFLGARGSKRGEDDWEVSFHFVASPNISGLAIGDIPGVDKKGWEYLWVSYEDIEDGDAKMLVKRPLAAFVEKVYESGDFSGIGIGV